MLSISALAALVVGLAMAPNAGACLNGCAGSDCYYCTEDESNDSWFGPIQQALMQSGIRLVPYYQYDQNGNCTVNSGVEMWGNWTDNDPFTTARQMFVYIYNETNGALVYQNSCNGPSCYIRVDHLPMSGADAKVYVSMFHGSGVYGNETIEHTTHLRENLCCPWPANDHNACTTDFCQGMDGSQWHTCNDGKSCSGGFCHACATSKVDGSCACR